MSDFKEQDAVKTVKRIHELTVASSISKGEGTFSDYHLFFMRVESIMKDAEKLGLIDNPKQES